MNTAPLVKPKIGLGLRRDLAASLSKNPSPQIDFLELVPENWMGLGGHWKKLLDETHENYSFTSHGLSLSLGGPDELNWQFLKELKAFLNEYQIDIYSEHLSYTQCDNAHLYDLLPIPFTQEAVDHVITRIKQVQDFLERPLLIENVSYYTPVKPEMDEASFITQILEKSQAKLLLDVNNVYVNAFNHNYDAKQFLQKIPLERVAYIHMAGHEQESDTLIIDTHGKPVIDPVYDLFQWVCEKITPVPVLLERDHNIPELEELESELSRLRNIAETSWSSTYAHSH